VQKCHTMIRNKHIHAGDLGMFDKGKMQVCVCARACVRISVFFAHRHFW